MVKTHAKRRKKLIQEKSNKEESLNWIGKGFGHRILLWKEANFKPFIARTLVIREKEILVIFVVEMLS